MRKHTCVCTCTCDHALTFAQFSLNSRHLEAKNPFHLFVIISLRCKTLLGFRICLQICTFISLSLKKNLSGRSHFDIFFLHDHFLEDINLVIPIFPNDRFSVSRNARKIIFPLSGFNPIHFCSENLAFLEGSSFF